MKTLVINLSKRKDRLTEFKLLNDDYISYELFNAVDGYENDYDYLLSQRFDIEHSWIGRKWKRAYRLMISLSNQYIPTGLYHTWSHPKVQEYY